jgi:hypothetical protein
MGRDAAVLVGGIQEHLGLTALEQEGALAQPGDLQLLPHKEIAAEFDPTTAIRVREA